MSLSLVQSGWERVKNQDVFISYHIPQDKSVGFVILVPPLGHEAFHSYRFYRLMALDLQSKGWSVLRFDLPGYGNSSSSTYNSEIHLLWIETIKTLIKKYSLELPVSLIGLRSGANLLKLVEADQHILIEPILSIKRFLREIVATSKFSERASTDKNGIESGGYFYSDDLLSWLKKIELKKENKIDTSIVTSNVKESGKIFIENKNVRIIEEKYIHGVLLEPQYTEIPRKIFKKISDILLKKSDNLSFFNQLPEINSFRVGERLKESVFRDDAGQFGIFTKPLSLSNERPTFVFINSGSGSHTGPNRVYVEACRKLSEDYGIPSIRFDMRNLGDSATSDIFQENHCYPASATSYIEALLNYLHENGMAKSVILAGICSGAHHALHMAIKGHSILKESVLINPLTFYWKEGMSIDMPEERKVTVDANYYSKKIKDFKSWRKFIRGNVSFGYIFIFLLRVTIKKMNSIFELLYRILNSVPNTKLNKDMEFVGKNRIGISIIVSDSDPGWGLLVDASKMPVKKFIKKFNVKAFSVRDANHTFSSYDSKMRLVNILKDVPQENISNN
ncbi:hypothetical protein ACVBEJ_11045 [Porticoccus sp. GXU_MW_L64]